MPPTPESVSEPLCTNALGTSSCEYVFYGDWSIVLLNYTCCSHGFSDPVAIVAFDEAYQCDDNANHSPYLVAANKTEFDGTNTIVTLQIQYDAVTCDSADPTNLGCCASDVKAVYVAMDTSKVALVAVATLPDAVPQFTTLASGYNITGGFGEGSSITLTLAVRGNVAASDICQDPLGCTYRIYGGPAYNTPYACCPTDYFYGWPL